MKKFIEAIKKFIEAQIATLQSLDLTKPVEYGRILAEFNCLVLNAIIGHELVEKSTDNYKLTGWNALPNMGELVEILALVDRYKNEVEEVYMRAPKDPNAIPRPVAPLVDIEKMNKKAFLEMIAIQIRNPLTEKDFMRIAGMAEKLRGVRKRNIGLVTVGSIGVAVAGFFGVKAFLGRDKDKPAPEIAEGSECPDGSGEEVDIEVDDETPEVVTVEDTDVEDSLIITKF